jgi:hypothetical protein
MKTIDTKLLLLGVLTTSLIITLTSSKSIEENNFDFVPLPNGVGIYNKVTKTIYLYKITLGGPGIQEKPNNIYKIADDGSSLTKKE